jgi:hypothetical protein
MIKEVVMVDRNPTDARAALDDAARAERRTRAAGRWFPGYLLALGVSAFVLIVAIEAVFPDGFARALASGVWTAGVVLLAWWADRHDVHPPRAGRRVLVAAAIWFGSYLLVIGPLVRWRAGDSLGWWTLAAAAMASPFLAAAWREWRRS